EVGPADAGDVDELRRKLDGVAATPRPRRRDQLAARSAERLEDDLAGVRVVDDRPLEDFERLPRRMNSVLLAVDGPHRRALPSQGWPKARWTTLDPAVEAGLVLPHVVAAREHRPGLHPDDLLMEEKPVLLPRLFDESLPAGGMPLVDGGRFGQRVGKRHAQGLGEE